MSIEPMVDPADVADLRKTFQGQIVTPTDAAYDQSRTVWNAMIDRRPAVILRCADTPDVVGALRFARERDLPISVRGGGHNVAGLAVCDDGVMIDLSLMRGVDVDPATRRATVAGGATWTDVDTATQQHGLAVTGGHVGSTGVGGLTLGGGFGWLHAKHGLTSDNLVTAEVVTAEGEVIRASETEHADLFWGLRGGGGNFGVVTSFGFDLHPVTEVFMGMFIFPRTRGLEIVEAYNDLAGSMANGATSALLLGAAPEVEIIPPELQGTETAAVIVVAPGASLEEGERLVAPIRALGATFELVQPLPYLFVQMIQDASWPADMHVYWKSGRLDALDDPTRRSLLEGASSAPFSAVIQLGGAIAERPRDATAFAHRDARFQYLVSALWEDPAEDDAQIAAARTAWRTVEPHTTGAFVNFWTTDDAADRVGDAYGAEHSRRLAALKKSYDPANVFRMNANITPA